MVGTPRLLLLFAGAIAIVVGAIVALTTGLWWVLAIVLIVHLIAFTVAITPLGRALRQGDKPDPVTEARLQDEGGREGEGAAAVAGEREGARGDGAS